MTFYYLLIWQVLNGNPNAMVFKLEKTRAAYLELLQKQQAEKLVYFKKRKVNL